jgi:hypothetical protein
MKIMKAKLIILTLIISYNVTGQNTNDIEISINHPIALEEVILISTGLKIKF